MTGRCAAVNSSHIHKAAFCPVHQHSFATRIKRCLPQTSNSPHQEMHQHETEKLLPKQRAWNPPQKPISGGEMHTQEHWVDTLIYYDSINMSDLHSV